MKHWLESFLSKTDRENNFQFLQGGYMPGWEHQPEDAMLTHLGALDRASVVMSQMWLQCVCVYAVESLLFRRLGIRGCLYLVCIQT